MKLELREITPDNWRDLRIEVGEGQSAFVSPVSVILARAYVYRNDHSLALAIYAGGEAIGLLLQRDYKDDQGRLLCILDQFLIDRASQGRGYGKGAMQLWLTDVKQKGKYQAVRLCFIRGAHAAENLYRGLGFVRKPQYDDGEELAMEYLL